MSQKWKYAALSESVYRRDHRDQAIDLEDIDGVSELIDLDEPSLNAIGLELDTTTTGHGHGYVYDPTNGFAAYVVELGGQTVIAFRGTDFDAQISLGSIGDLFSPQYRDLGDVVSNGKLGFGTYDIDPSGGTRTQWQSAKALIELLMAPPFDNTNSDIVVTGHSLGGGLAGLSAMTYGFDSYLFGPAPFKAQLDKEAEQVAAEYIINHPDHAHKFSETQLDENGNVVSVGFVDKWIGVQADALDISWLEIHERGQMYNNVKEAYWGDIDQILSDYAAKKAELIQDYNDRAATLDITSVLGEFTSNQDGWESAMGWVVDGATDFRPDGSYDDKTDIGLELIDGGEAISRHSPALNALVEKSQDGALGATGSFDVLLQVNQQVRHVMLNGGGIVGVNKNPKVGEAEDKSATGNPNPTETATVELFYRTLWKSVGSDDGLYNYIEQIFSDVIVHGMAADGLNEDPTLKLEDGEEANLNRGITHLAMGVFRDVSSPRFMGHFEAAFQG